MDFEIIIQECSLGDSPPKLLKPFRSVEKQMATRAINRKKYKQLLLLDGCTDFEIILQKCSLVNPLPKLFKWFHSVEQNVRQGYK